MPRIKADTIADHVAQQRAAVLEAAVRLFTTRGYGEVGLADIASEVGLARSSLYRYVPDKLHLLVEWYRYAVPRTVTEWERAVAGDGSSADRIKRWARTYLAWAGSPEHQLVAPLTESLAQLDDATRSEILDLHRTMMQVINEVVADAGIRDDQVAGIVELLAGATLGVGRAEARRGHPDDALRDHLDAAIDAILDPEARRQDSSVGDGHERPGAREIG